MSTVLVVGALVSIDGRGPGMLELDNEDGTWSIGFDDGSEGDIPQAQIVLSAVQPWKPAQSYQDGAALLAARHVRDGRMLAALTDERTKSLLKSSWNQGKFMAEIVPRLWIGDRAAAELDLASLRERGICAVLNCTVELPNYHEECLRYMRVPVNDADNADIATYFDPACNFVEEVLNSEGGAVLIHCHAGRSRSATIMLVCLMRRKRISLKEAIATCMERRWITPNPGFQRLLAQEECRLGLGPAL